VQYLYALIAALFKFLCTNRDAFEYSIEVNGKNAILSYDGNSIFGLCSLLNFLYKESSYPNGHKLVCVRTQNKNTSYSKECCKKDIPILLR